MTVVLSKSSAEGLWSSMPGWGIVADLTPPELIESRRVRVISRLIAAGVAVVLVCCAAGYVVARHRDSTAQDGLTAASQQTSELNAQTARYSDVTAVQAATQGIQSQLATLLTSDVDVAGLVNRVRAAAPPSIGVTTVGVTVDPVASVATSPGADPSELIIGMVTLAGTSRKLTDVATYATSLARLRGLVNVVPSTNTAGSGPTGGSWTVTLNLTDKLLTHRYDVTSAAATTTTPATGGN